MTIVSGEKDLIKKLIDKIFKLAIFFSAAVSGLLIWSILIILFYFSAPFFMENGFEIFVTPWHPISGEYGIFPMIAGTFFIAFPALAIAFPFSLGFAIFASETGPYFLKKPAIFLIRLASSIPTVVYSFVGVFLFVPIVRDMSGSGSGYSIFTACLVLAILISPTMIFFFYDSIKSVHFSINAGCDALGASKSEKLTYLILPYVKKGIYAGSFLGFGRAIGDTMISLMLAGNSISFPSSVWDSARTLTAHIGLVMAADYDSPEFRSIFACGLILYFSTAALSLCANYIYKGDKE